MDASNRPPLRRRTWIVLSLGGIGSFGLIVATTIVVHHRWEEQKRRETTQHALHKVAETVKTFVRASVPLNPDVVYVASMKGKGIATGEITGLFPIRHARTPADPRQALVLDGWGHAIRIRCPGPVHTHGWDAWSSGPNGLDESGQGDDILVGEDVACIGTDPCGTR